MSLVLGPSLRLSRRFSAQLAILLFGASLCNAIVQAQTAHPITAGTSFSSIAVGSTSTAQTLTFTFDTAGTLASSPYSVLTQGTPNLDFNAALTQSSTACVTGHTYNAGDTCTVDATFTPRYPGIRYGAVVLYGSTGGAVAIEHIYGIGMGPQIAFTPGAISTAAGITKGPCDPNIGCTGGYSGDGGPATSALLQIPNRAAFDSAGNLYIADTNNSVIRKLDLSGKITTIAGNGSHGYSGDNGPATSAQLNYPRGLAVDGAGNLFIADGANHVIRKVDAMTGKISTIAGKCIVACPAFDGSGGGYSGDGGPATSAQLNAPYAVAFDGLGNLYIADYSNKVIRKVDVTTGIITTVAGDVKDGCSSAYGCNYGYSGDNGPATSAKLYFPRSVTLDSAGNLYIAEGSNVIRKVDAATGIITTVAGDVKDGCDPTNGCIYGYSGDGGPATSAQLRTPEGVNVDSAGNLYIADSYNNAIRKVDAATHNITTIAGAAAAVCGSATDAVGDGCTATSAQLFRPFDVVVDSSTGNLYIADSNNNVIRKVNVNSAAMTFATPTAVGSTDTSDGPQTVTVSNIGNADLTIPALSGGTNPNVPLGFVLNNATTCPTPSPASNNGTLASGVSCSVIINFQPVAAGPNAGSLVLTDNALNAGSPYATQSIALSGTGVKVTPTAALTSSQNPSTTGSSVTFTATVAPSGATGTVTFLDGPTQLGTGMINGGVATYATSNLTVGTHSIAAQYNGDNNYNGANSAVLTQTVNAPVAADFTVTNQTTTSQQISASAGGTANYTIVLTSVIGTTFSNQVTLSASGGPTGYSYSFSPQTLTPGTSGGTSTLMVTVPKANVAASNASLGQHLSVTGEMLAAMLLPFTLLSRRRRSPPRLLLWILLTLVPLGVATGCSSGKSSPQPQPQPQNYTITITAASGNTVHTTTAALTVQ